MKTIGLRLFPKPLVRIVLFSFDRRCLIFSSAFSSDWVLANCRHGQTRGGGLLVLILYIITYYILSIHIVHPPLVTPEDQEHGKKRRTRIQIPAGVSIFANCFYLRRCGKHDNVSKNIPRNSRPAGMPKPLPAKTR